jgi:hypothetical protein
MTDEYKQLLWEIREYIANTCDENDLSYPAELIHKISMALGETYD